MKRLIAVLLLISILLCGCDILETQKTIHKAEEQLLRTIVENKELQNWLTEHPFDSVAKDAKANLVKAFPALEQLLSFEGIHDFFRTRGIEMTREYLASADSAAQTIINLGWTTISSFGTVMLTVVGQCIGAGEPEQAKTYTKKLLTVATAAMMLLFGSIFLFRHQAVQLFDFAQESLDLAGHYAGIYALCSIFSLYSLSFVPLSAFRAAGDIRYAVTLSICSMFAFRVALCFLLHAIFPSMGILCVYAGMYVDWIFRAIMNIFRYRSGKWLHKKLI